MEIDTWYKWMLVYFYDGGGILILLSTVVLAWKYRTLTLYLAAVSMFGFVVGRFGQSSAQRAIIEAHSAVPGCRVKTAFARLEPYTVKVVRTVLRGEGAARP